MMMMMMIFVFVLGGGRRRTVNVIRMISVRVIIIRKVGRRGGGEERLRGLLRFVYSSLSSSAMIVRKAMRLLPLLIVMLCV